MSAAAFAYVLLLRKAAAIDELLALLAEERRVEVQSILEKMKGLPPEQIGAHLRKLREQQIMRQRQNVKERIGLKADHVAPKLYSWLTRPF
jgi:DNA-binding transcriptional ArsR family regulator